MKKILQGIAIFMIAIFGACDIILLCLNEVSSAILSIIVTIVFVIIFIKVKETKDKSKEIKTQHIMTLNQRFSKKGSKAKYVVLVLLMIIIIPVIVLVNLIQNERYPKNSIMIAAKTSYEHSNYILDTLSNCGVKNIKSVTFDDFLSDDELTGYRIKTDEFNNVILYLYNTDKTIESIRYVGVYLFQNNKVVNDAKTAIKAYVD